MRGRPRAGAARLLAAVFAAVNALSGCEGAMTGVPDLRVSPWAVLDEGVAMYRRVEPAQRALERDCMAAAGYTEHPAALTESLPVGWAPIPRLPPRLLPTVEEAERDGFGAITYYGADAAEPKPSGDPTADDHEDGYDRELREHCAPEVLTLLYGDAQGPPEPVAFERATQWEMYYSVPNVVTAASAWSRCYADRSGEDDLRDLAEAAVEARAQPEEEKRLAVAAAECADVVGWRAAHDAAWATAMDRLVVEESADAIGAWHDAVAAALEEAEAEGLA